MNARGCSSRARRSSAVLDHRPQRATGGAGAGSAVGATAVVADAAEALVGAGSVDAADRLLRAWHRDAHHPGGRCEQAAVARCRALIAAARGDLETAAAAIAKALDLHHDDGGVQPARTLLVAGQIYRRGKDKERARQTLSAAVAAFDELGASDWAARARAELARAVSPRTTVPSELTVTERRVAELAAAGRTNREVAAALFISPKTVEANLARVYRKLAIGSRAELGAMFGSASGAAR